MRSEVLSHRLLSVEYVFEQDLALFQSSSVVNVPGTYSMHHFDGHVVCTLPFGFLSLDTIQRCEVPVCPKRGSIQRGGGVTVLNMII